jgi:glycosyltransferase involved in cell wall biosynthesis
MNKDVLVSVAMTNYNHGVYIHDAIKSIPKQSHTNWEIIIVDDASTDNSLELIQKYIKELKINDKVKVYVNDINKGYGYSLGRAIKCSSGELVAIVDSDDALGNNDAFKICIETHMKHPKAALTYSNYYECNSQLQPGKVYRSKQFEKGKTYLDGGVRVSHLKVIKKKYYDMTDGINPEARQSVDKELDLRIEEVGELIHIDVPLYYYRNHKDGLSRSIWRRSKEYQDFTIRMRKQIFEDAKKRRGL